MTDYSITTQTNNFNIAINDTDYEVNTEIQENNVSLSRVGSQGAKGDSVTQAYMDSNGDLHIVIRRANGDLVSDTNVGGSEYIDSLESLYDQFDDRYLGNKTSAPTVDNDGDALLTGALFFNTTTSQLGIYNGSSWEYPVAEATTIANNSATYATNAANSATSAATSATNAATSETNAATSESNALSSANAAATSESNAATSATNSANSASASATSATNSANSAAASSTSASNSAGSATNAATSANNAATSATNAATSESNAANSASAASTSATNAASYANDSANEAQDAEDSANAAAVSEQNASSSQQSAATSATNSANSATAAANSASSAAATLASVETIYDNFDDRFLGTKTTDPTTDNDGNSLVVGTFYYNSTSNELKVYSGSGWIAPSTSASNSASAAATSAASAATSASAASTSAANAATSASNASTSESNSSTYAAQALSRANAAATSAANAESLYDDFEDTYLGTKTFDPTTDNDGNALNTGALYFNSASGVLKVYDGSSWNATATTVAQIESVLQTLSLDNLTDVDTSTDTPENGDALVWDTNAWKTHKLTTTNISNIDESNRADGSMLIYNNSSSKYVTTNNIGTIGDVTIVGGTF